MSQSSGRERRKNRHFETFFNGLCIYIFWNPMNIRVRLYAWILLAVVHFVGAGPSKFTNFDELQTGHQSNDIIINSIIKIYIELSLIWDQSQLSSSIRLEMASKSKWGAPRDPIQFPRDLAERSTNFTRKLRSFRKNRDGVGALNCDAFGICLQMKALWIHFFRYMFETMCF